MLIPPIYARYGGTMGKTHGERKLNTPAASAISIEILKPASMRSIPNMGTPLCKYHDLLLNLGYKAQ
jgi:hypothetical protein